LIERIDAAEVGGAVVDLGGGRRYKEDLIDPSVGVLVAAAVGEGVRPGLPLCEIHARSNTEAEAAEERIRAAYRFSDGPVEPGPLVLRRF
jgi:thymidine phosphorylase